MPSCYIVAGKGTHKEESFHIEDEYTHYELL